jgi:hypothetical protein
MRPDLLAACAACLVFVIGFTDATARGAAPPYQSLPEAEIARLIRQLGHEHYSVREAASAELRRRPEARLMLLQARKDADAEVRRRAKRLADSLQSEHVSAMRRRAAASLLGGRFDRWADGFLLTGEDDNDACWQALFSVVQTLKTAEERVIGKASRVDLHPVPRDDYADYLRSVRPALVCGDSPDLRKSSRSVVRCRQLEATLLERSVVACVERAEAAYLRSSVAVVNGTFSASDVSHSLVICDGDFSASTVSGALIIARGKITADLARDSVLVSHAGVTLKYPSSKDKGLVIVKPDSELFDHVKFFELDTVGLKAADARGGVLVKAVERDSALARAGLREGDLITTVDGKAVSSAEKLRRMLRAQMCSEPEFPLTVRRGKESLVLKPTLEP